MAYFRVEDYLVYVPVDKLEELHNICEPSPIERAMSMLSDESDVALHAKVQAYLLLECRQDRNKFFQERVQFNLAGEKATRNAWTLLYDYCRFSGNAVLTDMRSSEEKLVDNYAGEDFDIPMGPIFAFDVNISRGWRGLLRKSERKSFRTLIMLSEVEQLVGDFSKFALNTTGFRMNCGDSISIMNRHPVNLR